MKFLEKRENSLWGRLRQGLRPRSHTGPVKFEDRYLKEGWTLARGSNMLSHMRQMRAWVVAHAPKNSKDLQRIQEVHVLNQEIWYSVYRRLWKQAVVFPIVFIISWKFLSAYTVESSGQHDYADTANYTQNPPFNHY